MNNTFDVKFGTHATNFPHAQILRKVKPCAPGSCLIKRVLDLIKMKCVVKPMFIHLCKYLGTDFKDIIITLR
jgi:hypothetical protein